jgi:hypothetical protein
MPSPSAIDVNCERLWGVAEWARTRGALSRDDVAFVRDTLPAALDSFPRIKLPKTIRLVARRESSDATFEGHSGLNAV